MSHLSHHHPRPTSGQPPTTASRTTYSPSWRCRPSSENMAPVKKPMGQRTPGRLQPSPTPPRTGSVPCSGVTETSETLVCENGSSCSVQDRDPLNQYDPEIPARGRLHKDDHRAGARHPSPPLGVAQQPPEHHVITTLRSEVSSERTTSLAAGYL